jgi:glycerol kinase
MQFQADIAAVDIRRPVIWETTALGAAYLAGIAAGVWGGIDEVRSRWKCDHTFKPLMEEAARNQLIAGWDKAVGRSRNWAEAR